MGFPVRRVAGVTGGVALTLIVMVLGVPLDVGYATSPDPEATLRASGLLVAVDTPSRRLAIRKPWVTPSVPNVPLEEFVMEPQATITEGVHYRVLDDLRVGDEVTIEYYVQEGRNVARAIVVGSGPRTAWRR